MRRRSPIAALAASPTMVGAVTTLIVIVAVFLAYNANNGLPFVPVYRVSVEIPDAARLGNNNEIRIGGTRVGVVESIDAGRSTSRRRARRRRAARTPGVAPVARQAQPQARQERRAAARRLDLPGPLPLVVRPQVPRDRPRRGRRRRPRATSSTAPTTGISCELPGRPQTFRELDTRAGEERLLPAADRVRRHRRTRSTRRPARRAAPTSSATATHSPAAAPRSTTRSPASSPLFAACGPSRVCSPSPTPSFAASSPRSPARPRSSPRSPSSRPTSSPRPRSPSRRSHPTRRRCRRRSPRARRRSRPRSTCCRASARSWPSSPTCSRRLRPGVSDLRATLPVLNSAIEVGTPVLRRSPRDNQRPRGVLRRAHSARRPADDQARAAAPARHLRHGRAAAK